MLSLSIRHPMYALQRAHKQTPPPSRHLLPSGSAAGQLYPMLEAHLLHRCYHGRDVLVLGGDIRKLHTKLLSAVLPILYIKTRTVAVIRAAASHRRSQGWRYVAAINTTLPGIMQVCLVGLNRPLQPGTLASAHLRPLAPEHSCT